MKNIRLSALKLLAGLCLCICSTSPSFAQSVWIGAGATGDWSDTGNWDGGVAPVNGNTLQFGSGLENATNNALAFINGLTFSNGSPSFTISGAPFSIAFGGGVVNNSSAEQTINNDLTTTVAPSTFDAAAGNLVFGGAINNGGNNLIIDGANNTELNGIVSGTGGLTKNGTGALSLNAANTYSGTTTLSAGTLYAGDPSALGTSTFAINGGTFAALGDGSANNNITIGGNVQFGDSVGTGNITNSGTVNLSAATRTVTVSNNTTWEGVVSNGGLTKAGNGTLTLSGNNTYVDGTTVNAGQLALGANNVLADAGALNVDGATAVFNIGNFNDAVGDVTLANGGRIIGTTGSLDGASYTVDQGIIGANLTGFGNITKAGTGTTVLSGNNTNYYGLIIINQGAILVANTNALGRSSALGGFGTVVNDGGALQLSNNISINSEEVGLIGYGVNGTGALRNVSGANTNGGVITLGGSSSISADAGTSLRISGPIIASAYDLLFTNAGAILVSGQITGTGLVEKRGTGTLTFSTANTYEGATIISNGALRIANGDALGTVNAGTTVANGAALELSNNITVASEELSMAGTGIGGAGALRNVSGINTYGGAITLTGGSATVGSDAGLLTISGNIGGAAQNLTFVGAGNTTVSGAINTTTGTVTKNNAGTVILSGNNTYAGDTTINGGILAVTNGAAIADTGAVIVADVAGATFRVDGSETIGSLRGTGPNGGVNLNGAGVTLTVAETGNQVFAGVISNSGGLTKTGAGTTTLGGANTYDGATAILGGALRITNGAGLGSTVGATTVTNGAALELAGNISTPEAITLRGDGIANNGALRNISGNNTASGNITLGSAASIGAGHATALNLTGGINGANQNLTFFTDGTGIISVASNITNSTGTLTKTGTGVLNLGGSNNYTGTTTISDGDLNVNSGNAITDTGTVVVANAAGARLIVSASETIGSLQGGGTTGGAVNLVANLTVAETNNQTYAGVFSNSGSLIKTGSGTMELSGNSANYGGPVAISNGAIRITTNNALGASGTATVSSNATLELIGGINTPKNLVLNGSGTNNNGALRNISGNNTASGNVALGSATTIGSDAGLLTVSGNINASNNLLTVVGAGNTTISGIITNSTAGLTKAGGGTLLLSGANTYTGVTTVDAGVLAVSNSSPTGAIGNTNAVVMSTNATAIFRLLTSETIGSLQGGGTTGGNVQLSNASVLTINEAGNQIYGGVISGNGSVIKTNVGTTILNGASTYTGGTTVNGGTLQVGNNNALGTGSVRVQAGTLDVGTFQLQTGAYTNGPSGNTAIAVASPGTFGAVNATGSAVANGTLTVTPINGFALNFGDTYQFLNASGGISGNNPNTLYDKIEMPSGQRGRVLLSNNNKTGTLLVAPASYVQVATTPNQANVAAALNGFIPATSGDRQTVSIALDKLTAGQYSAAFEQILPNAYASLPNMAFNTANALNNGLFQRLWVTRLNGTGFSASGLSPAPMQAEMGGTDDMGAFSIAPAKGTKWGTFVDGNGIFANGGNVQYLENYTSQSGGVTAGASYKWNENLAAGVYVGYQGLQAEYNNGRTIDNAVRFGLFGTYSLDNLYFNGLVGGAYHSYTVNRDINFSTLDRTATGRPGAGEFDAAIGTGYDFKNGDFSWGPFTTLQYTYLGVQGFNESGADSLNLNVSPYNSSSLLYTLGAQAGYNWKVSEKVVVTPTIFAGWQYEFLQNSYQINSAFTTGGPSLPFNYNTGTPSRSNFYGGVGATVGFGDRWQASAIYSSFVGGQNQNSQNVYLGIGYQF